MIREFIDYSLGYSDLLYYSDYRFYGGLVMIFAIYGLINIIIKLLSINFKQKKQEDLE